MRQIRVAEDAPSNKMAQIEKRRVEKAEVSRGSWHLLLTSNLEYTSAEIQFRDAAKNFSRPYIALGERTAIRWLLQSLDP